LTTAREDFRIVGDWRGEPQRVLCGPFSRRFIQDGRDEMRRFIAQGTPNVAMQRLVDGEWTDLPGEGER